ncbi:MAG TPA: copper resistance CopC family protein [Methylomirabilota bacterium]|nr:copper resistance CopC family protein [Methylomirabilota bacterium]
MIRVFRPVLGPALLLWTALAPVSPRAAAAHAIVLASSPTHDAVLAHAPGQVTLRFNSKIEKRFTRVTLAAGDQAPAPVALPAGEDAGPPDRLVIPLRPLRPGVYVLRYRVLAVDGHITEGALRFTVSAE